MFGADLSFPASIQYDGVKSKYSRNGWMTESLPPPLPVVRLRRAVRRTEAVGVEVRMVGGGGG